MGLYASLRIRGGLDDRKELERTTLDVLGNPGPPPAPPGPPTVPLPEWMTFELTLRLALTLSFLVLPSPRTIVCNDTSFYLQKGTQKNILKLRGSVAAV